MPMAIAKTVVMISNRCSRLGVSGDGGVPVRLGMRDGNRSDSGDAGGD